MHCIDEMNTLRERKRVVVLYSGAPVLRPGSGESNSDGKDRCYCGPRVWEADCVKGLLSSPQWFPIAFHSLEESVSSGKPQSKETYFWIMVDCLCLTPWKEQNRLRSLTYLLECSKMLLSPLCSSAMIRIPLWAEAWCLPLAAVRAVVPLY